MSDLDMLRELVKMRLSPYRFAHTLGVEETAATLAALYCPEKVELARTAALLHDMTKELTEAEQRSIMAANGVILRPDEEASPAIFHGITASLAITAEHPMWAGEIADAVRWHTTGHVGMTLFEAVLFLADYIEPGRTFADCAEARRRFFDANPKTMTSACRLALLREVLLFVLERTLASLQKRGAAISADTADTYRWLKNEKNPFS